MGFLKTIINLISCAISESKESQPGQSPEEIIASLERRGKHEQAQQYRDYFAQIEKDKEDYSLKINESITYEKLSPYKNTPRIDAGFIKDTAALYSSSSKNIEKITNAQMVLASVVQANHQLYKEGNEDMLPMVLVFALDEEHRFNTDWLIDTADKIADMKESNNVPQDVFAFIKVLRDDQSIFCFKLGSSLSGGADAWCVTYSIPKQKYLPGAVIPSINILPFLIMDTLKDDYQAKLAIVPSKYYTK